MFSANQLHDARKWLVTGLGYSDDESDDFYPLAVVSKIERCFPGGIRGFQKQHII